MISNIKSLKGVKQLSKPEQKDVKGGLTQTCKITITGSGVTDVFELPGFADGQSGSNQANNWCVDYLESPAFEDDRCFYDCEWDDNLQVL